MALVFTQCTCIDNQPAFSLLVDTCRKSVRAMDKQPHSTPKEKATSGARKKETKADEDESYSYSLDETGDSTRSLLSVLSHSSIGDMSKSDEGSSKTSESEAESTPRSPADSRSESATSKSRYIQIETIM